MASAESLRILRELQSRTENKVSQRFLLDEPLILVRHPHRYLVTLNYYFCIVKRHCIFASVDLALCTLTWVSLYVVTDMRGLQHQEPSVGLGVVWYLHVLGMQREAQGSWCAPQLRQVQQANTYKDVPT